MRCPHCGEPVAPGQERCFACGEKIRARGLRRRETPLDPRIIIIGAVLFIIALAGVLGVLLGSPGKKPAAKKPARSAVVPRIQDSLRRLKTPDTGKVQIAGDEIGRLRDRIDKIRSRYEKVKSQVLGETPTPEQRDLMNQIQRELGLMNSRLAEITSGVSANRKDELLNEFADAERRVNNLISQFSRAPKSR
jgi:archaellum component FlaC